MKTIYSYKRCKYELHLYNQNIHGCLLSVQQLPKLNICNCGEDCPYREEETISYTEESTEFTQ